VHSEIARVLETADDLHDLLSSTLVLRPRDNWSALWQDLVRRGHGQVRAHDQVPLWTPTDSLNEARAARAGDHDAVVHALRGHLELTGITSARALSESTSRSAGFCHHAAQPTRACGGSALERCQDEVACMTQNLFARGSAAMATSISTWLRSVRTHLQQ
jgi:hypothetical protein